jgi:Domain of unknown function (DUF4402)
MGKVRVMTLKRLYVALFLWLSLAASGAHAQTLSNIVPISFGNIIVGGIGDVSIAAASDTRSSTGLVVLANGGSVNRASVDVTYTPGAQVIISFPTSIVMTGPNSPSVLLELFAGAVQTIPLSGVLTVYFGGTLAFSTSGATGVVNGVIPVTIIPL